MTATALTHQHGRDVPPESERRTAPGRLSPALDFLQPIIVDDLRRFGRMQDGGYLLPASAAARVDGIVSLGLAHEWSFETDLSRARPELRLHAYDYSIGQGPFIRRVLRGAAKLLAGRTSFADVKDRIRTVLAYRRFFSGGWGQSRHFRERVRGRVERPGDITSGEVIKRVDGASRLLVKVDIDGDEYAILADLLQNARRIELLVIEFHDTASSREAFVHAAKEVLRDFEIAHIHGNNCAGVATDGLPDVLEVTFWRRDLLTPIRGEIGHTFARRRFLPLPGLDAANDPAKADYQMEFGALD